MISANTCDYLLPEIDPEHVTLEIDWTRSFTRSPLDTFSSVT